MSYLVLPLISFCSGEGVHSSLRCTTTFVIVFHWSLLLAFSQPFFLLSHNPPILAVVFFVVGNLLASLSHIFAIISRISFCPGHFIRPLNVLTSMQALVVLMDTSFSFSPLSLHRLFSSSGSSSLVYVVGV